MAPAAPHRVFLDLAYAGTAYNGWQVQPTGTSVQAVVEDALATLARQPVRVHCSGRTDAGVHALSQLAHADLPHPPQPDWLMKLNGLLPEDVSVQRMLFPTQPDLHARFGATSRRYRYRLMRVKLAHEANRAVWWPRPLDLDRLTQATEALFAFSDFGALAKQVPPGEHTLCTLHAAGWTDHWPYLTFEVEANRFLRGMVRTLVGSLLWVGLGKVSLDQWVDTLASQDRRRAAIAMPAHGLYFLHAQYPLGSFREVWLANPPLGHPG